MKRLFDDPSLSSELREELWRSRAAGHEYDVLAKLPQLRESLDGSHAIDSSLLEPASAKVLSRFAGTQLTGKLALLALAAAIGVAVYVALPAQRSQVIPEPAVQPAKPAPISPPTIQQLEPAAPTPEPEAIAPEQPAHEVIAPQPEANPRPAARFPRREIAQLVRIRELLEQDPMTAYKLAQRSEQEFPHGVLSEERRALQVLALAKSGDTQGARQKAQEFFARYPQSPMRELVEAALRRQ